MYVSVISQALATSSYQGNWLAPRSVNVVANQFVNISKILLCFLYYTVNKIVYLMQFQTNNCSLPFDIFSILLLRLCSFFKLGTV